MRESEVYRVLDKEMKKVFTAVNGSLSIFAQGMFDLAVWRETWESIIFIRKRLIWFSILYIFSPIKAWYYFAKVYANIKKDKLNAAKSQGTPRTEPKKQAEGPKKGILVPSKKILGANGQAIQSK